MRSTLDKLVAVSFALILIAPCVLWCVEGAGIKVPIWLSAAYADYLAGGLTKAEFDDTLSVDGFVSGKLQEAIETELGNHVPMKATAMLTNAMLQRGAICVANTVFSWPCYPTYYGSNKYYVPCKNAVALPPRTQSEETLHHLRNLGKAVAEFAKSGQTNRAGICIIQGYWDQPEVSPVFGLVSNPLPSGEKVEAVRSGVADAEGVAVVTTDYKTLDEYYEDFFRTDHHWNWRGIGHMYASLANELGLIDMPNEKAVEFGDYLFTGYSARGGLDLIQEKVTASDNNFSDLIVTYPDGTEKPYGHQDFLGRTDPGKQFGFYNSYYDFLPSGAVLHGKGEGRAVVVGNSFAPGILPQIAENYEGTLFLRHVHPSYWGTEVRLKQDLQQAFGDLGMSVDLYMVANPSDFAGFISSCPEYFS